ncbi:MAG: hypothetical protein OXT67_08410 [Zetaproteobacteria bacterium]|nr:hypothetical protein [Zetaproteobacteria bacterium]
MSRHRPHLNSLIGRVGKAHGLKGEFFLSGRTRLLSPSPDEVFLDTGNGTQDDSSARVLSHRVWKGRDLLQLDCYPDRTSVEKHHGFHIYGAVDGTEDLEYLLDQAVDTLSGEHIGTVEAITNYGAHDCIVMRHPSGTKTLELPFVDDYFQAKANAQVLLLRLPLAHFDDLWCDENP